MGKVYLFFRAQKKFEFDKMQIPAFFVRDVIPFLQKISLATIGVCVFVRLLR